MLGVDSRAYSRLCESLVLREFPPPFQGGVGGGVFIVSQGRASPNPGLCSVTPLGFFGEGIPPHRAYPTNGFAPAISRCHTGSLGQALNTFRRIWRGMLRLRPVRRPRLLS